MNSKGFSPWLLAALSAPLAQAASGHSWPTVLITGGVCLGISYLLQTNDSAEYAPCRWSCAIQWLWLAVVLSQLAHLPMACWPDYQSYIVVPLTLLVLAAWTAGKGRQEAARAGNTLLWILLIIFGTVSLAAVKEIRIENLAPQLSIPRGLLIVVFLIPCVMIFLPQERASVINLITVGGFAMLVSLLAVGVLSLPVAKETASPYYEMSRSLSLLGIAERFESLVAATMTLGYFALFALLAAVEGELTERIKPDWRRNGIWGGIAIAGAVFVSRIRVEESVLSVGCILIWVLLPLCEILCRKIKKLKR